MTDLTLKDGVRIFYKDWGPKDAQPVVFHHGWPLSADDWDNQMLFFLEQGYRVVAHDRRGHGRSDQTDTGSRIVGRQMPMTTGATIRPEAAIKTCRPMPSDCAMRRAAAPRAADACFMNRIPFKLIAGPAAPISRCRQDQ